MTWIRSVPPQEADDELRQTYLSVRAMYPKEYGGEPIPALVRPDGKSDSIMASHSLIPEAMRHMFAGLAVLLQPNLPLTRRQHEMIAALVSVENRCFY